MAEGLKQFVPHSPGCICASRGEKDCFIVHKEMNFSRRRDGRRGGSTLWHVFSCNDPDCPGEMGVRWDALADFLATAPQQQEGSRV